MQWIENLLVTVIAARMPRHHVAAVNDLDAIDVAFDHHALKGARSRHAVTIAIEPNGLILIHLARLRDACVEPMRRQSHRRGAILFESLTDRFAITGDRALGLIETTRAE